jgi:hypothetical protein
LSSGAAGWIDQKRGESDEEAEEAEMRRREVAEEAEAIHQSALT